MAVTIASVRTRWGVQGDASTDVTDALLTILLDEATTMLQGASVRWGGAYDTALTHLTAALAYEWVQSQETGGAVFGNAQSESFLQRSISRGGSSAVPPEWARFATTTPGMAFLQLAIARARARFPMVSSG